MFQNLHSQTTVVGIDVLVSVANTSIATLPLTVSTVNRLIMAALPGHLQIAQGMQLDSHERDVARADLMRDALRDENA